MFYVNPPHCKALSFDHRLCYGHDSPSFKKDYPKGPKCYSCAVWGSVNGVWIRQKNVW